MDSSQDVKVLDVSIAEFLGIKLKPQPVAVEVSALDPREVAKRIADQRAMRDRRESAGMFMGWNAKR